MVNKKAQSEVITIVLIILLVLAAIVILWQVVSNSVSEGGKQVQDQSGCMGVNLDVTNASGNTVIVRRGQGSASTSMSGFKVFINGVKVGDNTSAALDPLDTSSFTYSGTAIASGDKVEAAAIVGNNVVCAPSTYFTAK